MTSEELPRNQQLPVFNPHRATFSCTVEASLLPMIDAQADSWFMEARALESPQTIIANRDHTKIVRLRSLAAERGHWKAMLNLASMYLEAREPTKGVEDAVLLVEKAMRQGIPAAYDRMGTYYMNGTGVGQDTTRAFAFWQKAAEMGNPQAQTFLGAKLDATWDSSNGTHWANQPVAKQMLECAFSQGYGPAAYHLSFALAGVRTAAGSGNRTREESNHILWVLHQGVKFGCLNCGSKLTIEFGDPFHLADMLAPHIDKARSERYGILRDAIDFDPDIRFPNLDKVVPLPPAQLPEWNGDRDTLINAAMGVKQISPAPKPTAASLQHGRYFLDAKFHFRQTGDETSDVRAPSAGYWQPTGRQQSARVRAQLAQISPGLYKDDEPFERFIDPEDESRSPIFGIVWVRWDTKWHNDESVEPRAVSSLIREVPGAATLISSPSVRACIADGVWQPWVDGIHSMRAVVNQHWRQVWLKKSEPFPRVEQDWLLPIPDSDITWYLIDKAGVKLV